MARKRYSCDFETTTEINDCRVWAYGWMEIGNKSNFKIGNSLEEFMTWCEEVKADLYFHNLKFDGSFIINYLEKVMGFRFSRKPEPMTYNAIISRMGQWYMIDICYGYTKTKKPKKLHTVIYDSLKKLPFKVKDIATSFKLELRKGDIDYQAYRPIGHEITEEEFAYIKNDIEIVADALEIQFKQGLKKMTSGSDSLAGFKDVISDKAFKKLFPVLNEEADREIRKAYRGGFTWANERFKALELGMGLVYDVNSLYPSVMYNRLLPYGTPKKFIGKYEHDEEYPLHIQHLSCEFELKKDHIPTIQIKDVETRKRLKVKANEYLHSSKMEKVELVVTNIDLELIKEHYRLFNVEYIDGVKFRARTGIFKDFIDKWMYIKNTSKGAIKQLAKLMLNSLYGKFGSNPDVTGKIPYIKENGALGFTMGDKETKDPVYIPMGVFVTSWARHVTITTAQKCFDRIAYCDTDSIHLIGTEIPEVISDIIDPKKLGYWKHESTFEKAKFVKQKTYVELIFAKWVKDETLITNDQFTITKLKKEECEPEEANTRILNVKCAGMSEKAKSYVTFENFNVGLKVKGNLKPKQVPGGVVLLDDGFEITAG
jgi:hypothetical protein